MTLAEKLVHLRAVNNISQEELAHQLDASRQSVSKWESGESSPSIDNIKQLCSLFRITADDLLNDEVIIHRGKKIPKDPNLAKTKYFGTD